MNNKEYFTLLAKPTYACNMNCPQCYLKFERNNKKGTMNDEVLSSLIKKATKIDAKYVSIQWIGGESLLVGVDFYKRAAALIRKYSSKDIYVDQWIQTNASLLNDEWVKFFLANPEIHLSISFEITRELQDKLRPLHKNKSSYDIVKNNIRLLNESEIKYGVLTVITKDTLNVNPADWLYAIIESGIKSVGLQICYQDFYWGDKKDTEACMNWIAELFCEQAEYNNDAEVKDCLIIRESLYLYHYLRNYNVWYSSCHNCKPICTEFLFTVDVDGDIFGYCDAFMGTNDCDKSYHLGNVTIDEFTAILNSEKYKIVRDSMLDGRKECEDCDIYTLCNGGCTIFRTKKISNGNMISVASNENYCKIQKSLFNYVINIENRPLLRKMYWFYEDRTRLLTPLDYRLGKRTRNI